MLLIAKIMITVILSAAALGLFIILWQRDAKKKRQVSPPSPLLSSSRPLPALLPPMSKISRFRHTRLLTSLLLVTMVLIALCFQSGLTDGALRTLGVSLGLPGFDNTGLSVAAHPIENASKALIRLWQVDPTQYKDTAEFNTWAYSACSTASMAEVFNAWGHNYRITDVLKVQVELGEISAYAGLLHHEGIARTAARFGFKTNWGDNWQLDQVLDNANHGRPVIVSFPPDRYDGGHLLVVIGGDANNVYLADSSGWNRKSLTHAQFMGWWEGYAAVITPQ